MAAIRDAASATCCPVPTIYVATGSQSLTTYTVAPDGALAQAATIPMPGPVSDVKWDRATNMVHVLGATADGTPTIYVVEPHGNAVFTDVPLEFKPATWVLDAQPNDPGNDRQRAIAFASAGLYATVDTGSHAFGWRLPGVVLGTLTVGLLYLMARLLFPRRRVALLFAGILAIDGLLFQQSRIAMNDVYALFFIVAGFTLLAYFLQSVAVGRRARLELLTIPPLLGVLFGLGARVEVGRCLCHRRRDPDHPAAVVAGPADRARSDARPDIGVWLSGGRR